MAEVIGNDLSLSWNVAQAGAGTTVILGNNHTTTGTINGNVSTMYFGAVKTLAAGGTVTNGYCYFSAAQPLSTTRFVIYNSDGTFPTTVVGFSATKTGTTVGLNAYTFTTPLTLPAGNYHVALHNGPNYNQTFNSDAPADTTLRDRATGDGFSDGPLSPAQNPPGTSSGRRRLYAEVTVPVAVTAVSSDLSLSWHALSAASRTLDCRWSDYQQATQTLDCRWSDKATASASALDARWDTRALAGRSTSTPWHLRARIANGAELIWHGRTSAGASITLPWQGVAHVSSSLSLPYHLRRIVAGARLLPYDIRGTLAGSVELDWHLRNAVGETSALLWDVTTDGVWPAGSSLAVRWHVLAEMLLEAVSASQPLDGTSATALLEALSLPDQRLDAASISDRLDATARP